MELEIYLILLYRNGLKVATKLYLAFAFLAAILETTAACG